MADSSVEKQILEQKLETAHKNIQFLQKEHSRMLFDLHNEVKYFKDKCKRLQFSLEVADITAVDEDRYITRVNALESEVVHWCQECRRLQDHLRYAEDVVSNLENVLAKQYQQSESEIGSRDDKISSLEKELAQKSRTISYLMAELHQHRNIEKAEVLSKSLISQPTCMIPQSSLDHPSATLQSLKESFRNSGHDFQTLPDSLSKRIQSSLEKDKKARTMSLLETSIERKMSVSVGGKDSRHSSVTRLPPIVKIPHRITPSPSIKRSGSKQRSFVRQQLRLTEPEVNIETLAIDQSIKTEPAIQSADQL